MGFDEENYTSLNAEKRFLRKTIHRLIYITNKIDDEKFTDLIASLCKLYNNYKNFEIDDKDAKVYYWVLPRGNVLIINEDADDALILVYSCSRVDNPQDYILGGHHLKICILC